jgi:hypothetical protein
MDVEAILEFIKATGGGKGKYSYDSKGQTNEDRIFYQDEHCGSERCGFGRLHFHATGDDFKLFLRIPHTSDPRMVLHFMQTVWNLPSPKLIIGITGGAKEFNISPELEIALGDLMHITQETDAWIVTGGTSGGIMKHFGMFWEDVVIFRFFLMFDRLQVKLDFDSEETFP